MSFDLSRVRRWDWAVGLLGGVLLAAMFLPWYGVTGGGAPTNLTADAWQSFAVIDVFVAIAGLMAIALVVFTALHRTAAVPQALATLTTTIAGVAAILLVIRTVALPGIQSVLATGPGVAYLNVSGVTREVGLWLGLASSLALVVSSWQSMTDERVPQALSTELTITKLPAPGNQASGE